jgi:hypothetical protein
MNLIFVFYNVAILTLGQSRLILMSECTYTEVSFNAGLGI